MSVHIGELHSEVTPLAAGQRPQADEPQVPLAEQIEERIREAQCRADRLSARVAAEGFDD